MELVYGTKNKGKLAYMQKCLHGLSREQGLKLTGLHELGGDFPDVEEDGANPLDNARKKALAYYAILKRPVFSLDSSLYFDGLPEHLQPGLDVRRVNGKRLSDDEMLAYYASLAQSNGGSLSGRYRNGICLVASNHSIMEHDGEDIASERFMLVAEPHEKRMEGFPLDSLSVHIESGAYYYDRKLDKEEAWHTKQGFQRFFAEAMRTVLNT